MLGYLVNARVGLAAAAAAVFLNRTQEVPSLLIWTAHIGLDQLLGYGLKYPTAFGDTHLGS